MREDQDSAEGIPPRDISSEVIQIIDSPNPDRPRTVRLIEFLSSLRDEPSLSLTMDWRGPELARWTKAFVEGRSGSQERTAAIRCTKSQKAQAENVFASGVEWMNSNEQE